jgi:hypothetical protein
LPNVFADWLDSDLNGEISIDRLLSDGGIGDVQIACNDERSETYVVDFPSDETLSIESVDGDVVFGRPGPRRLPLPRILSIKLRRSGNRRRTM